MIVGAEGKCMERVGWRTGSEEMKADEVTREMQKKSSSEGWLRSGTTNTTPGTTSSRPPVAGCTRPDDETKRWRKGEQANHGRKKEGRRPVVNGDDENTVGRRCPKLPRFASRSIGAQEGHRRNKAVAWWKSFC